MGGKIPVYPVQYLHKKPLGTWTRTYSEACRNHGPGLRKEKRKVIYQKKKEGNVSKRKVDPHTKKLEAVLKHKHRVRKKKEQCSKKNLYNPKLFIQI